MDDDDDDEVVPQEEPWRLAVSSSSLQQLQDLVQERGLAVLTRNAVDRYGTVTTPLLVAVSLQHIDMVRYLLEECSAVVDVNDTSNEQEEYGFSSLHLAIQGDSLELVRYLVEKGCDVNAVTGEGDKTPLHMAIEMGHEEIAKYLIDTGLCNLDLAMRGTGTRARARNSATATALLMAVGYRVDSCDYDENLELVQYLMERGPWTEEEKADRATKVLPAPCQNGDLEMVTYLVESCRADVNAHGVGCFDGLTPLNVACDYGYLEIVQYLAESCQADVEGYGSNDRKMNPLLQACSSGRLEIVQYLIEKCAANVETRGGNMESTPLYAAIQSDKFDVVQYLVEKCRVDVEAKGHTALHAAATYGRLNTVQYLVEKGGSNIEAKNVDQWTALHIACQRHNENEIVQYLVDVCHANVNVPNIHGETALHIASKRKNVEMVQCLVESGRINVNAVDKNGQTAMHIWLLGNRYYDNNTENCLQIFKILATLEQTNFETQDNDGQSILHLACEKDALLVVQYLVRERRVDVTAVSNVGETALHSASREMHAEIVQCLVQSGRININAVNAKGQTAMHSCLASIRGDGSQCDDTKCLKIAKILAAVEHQANFETRDNDGQTILHLACQKGLLQFMQYLVQECHVDVNVASGVGETALHLASQKRHVEMVQCMVQSGRVNVNAVDTNGQTAMHRCLVYHSLVGRRHGRTIVDDTETCLQITKIFVAVDPTSVEIRDNNGRTMLHLACEKGALRLVQYLVQECRVNINAPDCSLRTALHTAGRHGHFTTVEYLVGLPQTDVNAADSNGCTPLHVSCAAASTEIPLSMLQRRRGTNFDDNTYWKTVQCLLKADRVEVNALDNQGKTVLHHSFVNPIEIAPNTSIYQKAIKGVCFKIMQSSVESGQVNVDATDNTGQTVLHYYCSFPNIDIPRYLIEHGKANVDVVDNEGRTALHRAVSSAGCNDAHGGLRLGIRLVLFLVSRHSTELLDDDDDENGQGRAGGGEHSGREDRIPKRRRT